MKPENEAVVESHDILKSRSLKHWGDLPPAPADASLSQGATVHCGWGRLLFGQTFDTAAALAEAFRHEHPDERDIALYVRDPHVVTAHAPHALFLDPSFTFRLDLRAELHKDSPHDGIIVRMASESDEAEINRIYLARRMVPPKTEFLAEAVEREDVYVLVAEDRAIRRYARRDDGRRPCRGIQRHRAGVESLGARRRPAGVPAARRAHAHQRTVPPLPETRPPIHGSIRDARQSGGHRAL